MTYKDSCRHRGKRGEKRMMDFHSASAYGGGGGLLSAEGPSALFGPTSSASTGISGSSNGNGNAATSMSGMLFPPLPPMGTSASTNPPSPSLSLNLSLSRGSSSSNGSGNNGGGGSLINLNSLHLASAMGTSASSSSSSMGAATATASNTAVRGGGAFLGGHSGFSPSLVAPMPSSSSSTSSSSSLSSSSSSSSSSSASSSSTSPVYIPSSYLSSLHSNSHYAAFAPSSSTTTTAGNGSNPLQAPLAYQQQHQQHQQQQQQQQYLLMNSTSPPMSPHHRPSSPSALPITPPNEEEISTLFIVGFPDDFMERELENMFLFAQGYESSTLKRQDRKQLIGFVKFHTRADADIARDVLLGRVIDHQHGSNLKVEIAKKNLHIKRNNGNGNGNGLVNGNGDPFSPKRNNKRPGQFERKDNMDRMDFLSYDQPQQQQQQQPSRMPPGADYYSSSSTGGSSGGGKKDLNSFYQFGGAFSNPPYTMGQQAQPHGGPFPENPPCNTLYVGNLPSNADVEELRSLFSGCYGYSRMSFQNKANGPMCFVEFEDVPYATDAMNQLHGYMLRSSLKSGIRLSYAKNPLGMRTHQALLEYDRQMM